MKGVRQGCIISPNLFNIYAEIVLRKTLEKFDGGIRIGGRHITNLRYADDIVLLAATEEELQDLVNSLRSVGDEYGVSLNVDKTEVMVLGNEECNNAEWSQTTLCSEKNTHLCFRL